MKRVAWLLGILLSVSAIATVRAAEARYTRSMFERAVKDTSSPRYVLFLLRDSRTNSAQTVCTLGSALIDAIQIEHDWNYVLGGRTKARGLALRHWNEPFAFEKSNAAARTSPRYTRRQLAEVRARLARSSNAELKSQLRAPFRRHHLEEQTELQKMCAARDTPIAYSSRAALAHVLLERGILVANDERTGQLRLP